MPYETEARSNNRLLSQKEETLLGAVVTAVAVPTLPDSVDRYTCSVLYVGHCTALEYARIYKKPRAKYMVQSDKDRRASTKYLRFHMS